MASSARVHFKRNDAEVLEVEVTCDEGRPDVLDEITRRAEYLFDHALASVTPATD